MTSLILGGGFAFTSLVFDVRTNLFWGFFTISSVWFACAVFISYLMSNKKEDGQERLS